MTYVDFSEVREHLSGLVAHEGGANREPAAPFLRPYVWRPSSEIPRREFVYGHHFIRDFTSATFAPGGVGKSMLEIAEALAMTSGKPLLGVQPPQRLKVAYWNGEDPIEETERRISACMIQFGLRREDVEGWFFWGSGREEELVIAEQTRDGTTIIRPNVERVERAITEAGLDVLMVDPFISTHRVTENDNNAVDLVAKTWGGIAGRNRISLDLVHHTTKAALGRETRVEDGRGGGALLYAVRSARVLNTMSPEEATAAGVEAKRRRFHFRVDNGKANLAPPPEGSTWYNFVEVDLGNGGSLRPGDRIGVPVLWQWPEGAPEIVTVKKGMVSQPLRLSPAGQKVWAAFGRLHDEGKTYPAPNVPGVNPGTAAVQEIELRNQAIEMGIYPEPKPDRADEKAVRTWQAGARNAWKRGHEAVTSAGLLRYEAGFFWEPNTNQRQRVTSRAPTA